jgi:radical SAM superfamily enzyme YgiQ (UPF0313 family)
LERCRELGCTTVAGGPFVSQSPEDVTGRADVLVIGEAETALPPFLRDLEHGDLKLVYHEQGKPSLDMSPLPRYDLLPLNAYGVIDVQFSRGCPFNCEFCDIIELYGHLPRTKSPQQILAELDELMRLGYRGSVFLVDDNFIGNKRNVRLLLKELIPWQKAHDYPFLFTTEATVNLADDTPLLADMREAGFIRVFLGIETPSVEALKETQKLQNIKRDLVASVQHIMSMGLEVTAGFIVGFDTDTEDIFDRQIDFIRQAGIPWAMVGVLMCVPGTQLWRRLEREGRLFQGMPWHQYAAARTNFQTVLDPEVLLDGYLRILKTIYEPDAYYERVMTMLALVAKAPKATPKVEGSFMDNLPMCVLRATWAMGVKASHRMAFWRFVLRALWRFPRRFLQAMDNAAAGHHMILFTRDVIARNRALPPAAVPPAAAPPAPALANP